jgi:hypothetical protein
VASADPNVKLGGARLTPALFDRQIPATYISVKIGY